MSDPFHVAMAMGLPVAGITRYEAMHVAIEAMGSVDLQATFYHDPAGGRVWWQAGGELHATIEDAVLDAYVRAMRGGA